ncbi:MAG: hypothetical protein H6711_19855 [Myxococcales bacterium]|nr:hypothetical protein [Myxococcales bacterium]
MVTVTVAAWLSAYLLTQSVEIPIYVMATRGRPWRARLVIAAAASQLTHPMVWFVIPAIPWPSYDAYFAGAEGFAVLVEALLLWGLGVRRALFWSIGANASSVAVGSLLRATVGWP